MTDPTTSSAPGAESHVPGQDSNDASAAGAAPGGTGLDASTGPAAPSEDVLGSAGDSLGDDDVLPRGGMNDAGEQLPDGDTSVTSTSASEPPD
jgi:hypothetical protein